MDSARDGPNEEDDVDSSALSSSEFSSGPPPRARLPAGIVSAGRAHPLPSAFGISHHQQQQQQHHFERLSVRHGDADSAQEDEDEDEDHDESSASNGEDGDGHRGSSDESEDGNVFGHRDLFERYAISSIGRGGLLATAAEGSASSPLHEAGGIQRIDSASEAAGEGGLRLSSLQAASAAEGPPSAALHQSLRERSAPGSSRLRQESSDMAPLGAPKARVQLPNEVRRSLHQLGTGLGSFYILSEV